MTIAGFLDFQEGTIWQSEVAFAVSAVPLATANTVTFPSSGTYVCSNWQATQLRCSTTLGIGDFTAQWFDDAAGTNQIGERRWSVYDGWALTTFLTLANLGPYLKLQVSNFTGGNINAFIRGLFSNRVLAAFQPHYSTPMLAPGVTNVGAVSVVIRQADYLYSGPAFAFMYTDSPAFAVNLEARASNGTNIVIAQWEMSGHVRYERRYQMLNVPPLPIQVRFSNDDAAAQNFNFTLTPDLFH